MLPVGDWRWVVVTAAAFVVAWCLRHTDQQGEQPPRLGRESDSDWPAAAVGIAFIAAYAAVWIVALWCNE